MVAAESRCATIFEVVACDAGYDRRERGRGELRLGHAFGLLWVEGKRLGSIHLAKAARTRAAVAIYHECRGAVSPHSKMFGHPPFLADGHEPEAAHGLAERRGTPYPCWRSPVTTRAASTERKAGGRVNARLGEPAEQAYRLGRASRLGRRRRLGRRSRRRSVRQRRRRGRRP